MSNEQAPTYAPPEVMPDVWPNDQRGGDLQVVPTLAECEEVIERGRRTFIEVGRALAVIRDGRLYRETHPTFEAYCRERWGWSRSYAYRQIAASEMAQMSPMGDIQNERQARALRVVEPDEEAAVEEPVTDDEWRALVGVMNAIESLAGSDAAYVAATVPSRRRAATAKRLRKLGTYLGGIAWTLEGPREKHDDGGSGREATTRDLEAGR